ncbi:MAG: hypothetical protein IJ042_08935 [Butyricicoccus sp.]|nr:hypothetical protein [Butyricicoccus sp.]
MVFIELFHRFYGITAVSTAAWFDFADFWGVEPAWISVSYLEYASALCGFGSSDYFDMVFLLVDILA